MGVPETLQLILTFGGGVATGLVANWLYDKLSGRTKKLRIGRVKTKNPNFASGPKNGGWSIEP